ncbi:MAG: hypothetical protein FF85_03815 [alpha proteobacterium QL1]|nr:MAG: hypothetical protein FF85_03815 [alpha proteobacterium QL1]
MPKAYFPEHLAKTELKNPSLVIALANSMEFNVTIDNGVMHMLGLSSKKLFCFFTKTQKNLNHFEKMSSFMIVKMRIQTSNYLLLKK